MPDDKLGSVETPIGKITTLAEGSVARLFDFRHHNRPHRDPDGEVFDQPTIIFTVGGTWGFRSMGADKTIDRRLVVLGRAGQAYQCRHREEIPTDHHAVLRLDERVLRDLLSRCVSSPLSERIGRSLFPRTVIPKIPVIAKLETALLIEAQRRRPGHLLTIDLLAVQLLVEIARLTDPELGSCTPVERVGDRDRVEAAKDYLTANFAGELNLATLARSAGLSPFHFGRMFKAYTGVPPHQYLMRIRVEEAKRLLRDSTRSVTDVCYEVGFRNLSHFIATFRARTGVTPGRYRRH